jgi:hypothetical protein
MLGGDSPAQEAPMKAQVHYNDGTVILYEDLRSISRVSSSGSICIATEYDLEHPSFLDPARIWKIEVHA